MPETFDIVLAGRQAPAPGLRLLRFARADGMPLGHRPGQFIQLHLAAADGSVQRRSYSLSDRADQPLAGNQFEFALSRRPGGLASEALEQLPLGGVLAASGPQGRFLLEPRDAPARLLLLATGTGVSPFRAMLPELVRRLAGGAQVVLLHGARSEDMLPYAAEFAALAAQQPGFAYRPCLSRQWPASLPGAQPGYVQDALAALAPDPAADMAWLCGNPGMVDAGFAALRAAGFGMARIRREKYLAG